MDTFKTYILVLFHLNFHTCDIFPLLFKRLEFKMLIRAKYISARSTCRKHSMILKIIYFFSVFYEFHVINRLCFQNIYADSLFRLTFSHPYYIFICTLLPSNPLSTTFYHSRFYSHVIIYSINTLYF